MESKPNLRIRSERVKGYYKLLATGKLNQSYVVAPRKPKKQQTRRRLLKVTQHEAEHEFFAYLQREIINGLKFRAKASLQQCSKIQISKDIHEYLKQLGFSSKWHASTQFLAENNFIIERFNSRGERIGILSDTFKARVVSKKPIFYYDHSLLQLSTCETFWFMCAFQTDQ